MSESDETVMNRRMFTSWDLCLALAVPTSHWAPYAELRGLAILVVLVSGTRALWWMAKCALNRTRPQDRPTPSEEGA